MITGADVNNIVTTPMILSAEAETGGPIQFWGRYFKEAGNTSPEQYQAADEATVLHARGIRVLPIGRQTNHVGGSEELGRTDGANNAEAIIDSFGRQTLASLPAGLLVFVDVEGPPHASLSESYYKGWSEGLSQTGAAAGVRLLPGVYGAHGDRATWQELANAVAAGAACAGTWIARLHVVGCDRLRPFDEGFVRPVTLPNSIDILIWQCVQECHNLDFNILNPDFEADTLGKLVLPEISQQAVA